MKRILLLIFVLTLILRFYKLGENPPSLYWDEASLGYNAYSLLKTAKDEHGVRLPITNFAAFGDYKPPGYIYTVVPFIQILGLNEFSVRLPSAFFGTLTVLVTFLIANKIFPNKKISLTAAFLLAISPWHIQHSRAAFEANLGLFFSTTAIYFFLKFATEKAYNMFPSAAFFLAAMYTFTGQRLFVPLILIVLIIQFHKQVLSNIKLVIITAVISAFLFWPLFKFANFTIEGKQRFNEVTFFRDLKPIDDSISYREDDNFSIFSNLIHNRRLFYLYNYFIHYLDFFNPSFLFINGDQNPRLSIQELGHLYYFEIILIISGIYYLFRNKANYRFLIIGWLLISPLGPAVARETPHALRVLHILPTFQLISAYGFYHIYNIFRARKLFYILSFFALIPSIFYYLHLYYYHYPKDYSYEWQYGYKQAVEFVKNSYSDYDQIFVTKAYGRPYIYFVMYMPIDPRLFQQSAQITRDNQFFYDVKSYDKLNFGDLPQETLPKGKNLYVVTPGEIPKEAHVLTTVYNLASQPVFEIGELQR